MDSISVPHGARADANRQANHHAQSLLRLLLFPHPPSPALSPLPPPFNYFTVYAHEAFSASYHPLLLPAHLSHLAARPHP